MLKQTLRCGMRQHFTSRALSPPTLLETVRSDPGMTAIYYANRYFGPTNIMEVTQMLWGELKLYGQVTIDRIDGPDAPPRWYPVWSFPHRVHRVVRHRAEDEDLSVLRDAPPVPPSAPHAPPTPSSGTDSNASTTTTTTFSSSTDAEGLRAGFATPSSSSSSSNSSNRADIGGGEGKGEGEDASVRTVEDSVLYLVHSMPGQDIQTYISELPAELQPAGPAAFRRLRIAGLLTRERTIQGSFIWK